MTVLQAQYDECAVGWETHYDSEQECRDEGDLGSWTLARGDSFADALSAASAYVGPTLITPQDRRPEVAFEPLEGRLSNQATVIGEEDVIGETVVERLVPQFARITSRYAGPTRYDTAVEVAQLHRDGYGGSSLSFFEVVIVNGERWPDALTASALTGIQRVVLPTTRDHLPQVVADYLDTATGQGSIITVVGGTDAVSHEVMTQLEELNDSTVRRIAGSNRFETARAVADVYFEERGVKTARDADPIFGVLLVRPDTFADAIAAPNLTRTRGAPLLIAASNDDLGEENANWLAEHADQVSSITALGTAEVVADRVLDQAEEAVCDARQDC